jgi:hypothetical protein
MRLALASMRLRTLLSHCRDLFSIALENERASFLERWHVQANVPVRIERAEYASK